jgi:YebC/PmpR family DNA-binding regulatory protein
MGIFPSGLCKHQKNKRVDMGAQWKARHKEIAANAKGRIFGKLSKEIMVAARTGADPDMNPRLRLVVEQAKKASMPRETLERAIKKGAGLLDEGTSLERLTYEGFAPHRVPVIVECLTDNINRTLSNIRVLFRKGQLGATGSVSWDFNYQGMIEATPNSKDADAELAAIEAGAQDFEPAENGATLFLTDSTDLDAVCRALPAYGFTVQSAQLGYRPKNPVVLNDTEREEVEVFLEAIDADDDVQNVYVGLAG